MSEHDRISELYRGTIWGEAEQRAARDRIDWICARARGRVLDIGCSQGIAGIIMARAGLTVLGVDRDPAAIDFANEDLAKEPPEVQARVRFVQTEAEALPDTEGFFDTVVLGEILEHQTEPERLLALARERLRPGGRVVITVPFGLHLDPDHRVTFYLSSLAERVGRFFAVSELDVAHKYILCLALKGESPAAVGAEVLGDWLHRSENAFFAAEQVYLEREKILHERIAELSRHNSERLQAIQQVQQRLAAQNQALEKLKNEASAEKEARRRQEAAHKELLERLTETERRLSQELAAHHETRHNLETSTAALAEERRAVDQQRREIESLTVKLRGALTRSEEANRKLQKFSSESERHKMEIARLTQTLSGLRGGVRYRLGDALVSCAYQPRKILSLPGSMLGLFREGLARRRARRHARAGLLPLEMARSAAATSRSAVCAGAPEVEADDFVARLRAFLDRAARMDPSAPFVFMFSGTIHIQEKRANRPIRLTRALRDLGSPVLFSYFRWDPKEPVPRGEDPLLFQSPIDRTLQLIRLVMAHDFGPRRKLFVLSFPYPEALRFLNEFSGRGWVTYYDVRDDWEEFSKVGMARWYDRACERYALSNCDLASAVSEPLRKKMEALSGRPVRLSPNAYDPAFLKSGIVGEPGEKPAEIVLGYFGHLTDRWFDYPALFSLSRARPDWRIELIGHGLPESVRLPENISYRGFLSHEEICPIARRWRCGLIPFVPGKLSEAVDPIKIYEYLALGLPTAAVSMPQVAGYPYAHLARGREDLLAAVERCLTEKIEGERIRAFLTENTWARRAEEILDWAFSAEIRPALRSLAAPPGVRA